MPPLRAAVDVTQTAGNAKERKGCLPKRHLTYKPSFLILKLNKSETGPIFNLITILADFTARSLPYHQRRKNEKNDKVRFYEEIHFMGGNGQYRITGLGRLLE